MCYMMNLTVKKSFLSGCVLVIRQNLVYSQGMLSLCLFGVSFCLSQNAFVVGLHTHEVFNEIKNNKKNI